MTLANGARGGQPEKGSAENLHGQEGGMFSFLPVLH